MLRALIALLCLLAVQGGNAAQITVRDDRGMLLRLASPARRVIALAPHLTEIAFAAGAGGSLVAVSAFSDYPPQARNLPRVGDGARVDIERILTLKPDLVLAWKSGNHAADITRLERFGIAVWVSEARRLADIARLLRDTARLVGAGDVGERTALRFEQALQGLRDARAHRGATLERVRVFYEIWHAPLITVNREHIISEIVELCGGTNVFADVSSLTPSVTTEALLEARPQLLLGGGSHNQESAFAARWHSTAMASLRGLPARFVPPDLMQRASPRMLDGIHAVCAHINAVRGARQSPRW